VIRHVVFSKTNSLIPMFDILNFPISARTTVEVLEYSRQLRVVRILWLTKPNGVNC
jgi:hypothetical protein